MTLNLFARINSLCCQALTFFVLLWQKTRFARNIFSFPQCRFYPSCSNYFLEAVKKHGLILGIPIFLKRLFRCNPLCEGGIDEVHF